MRTIIVTLILATAWIALCVWAFTANPVVGWLLVLFGVAVACGSAFSRATSRDSSDY